MIGQGGGLGGGLSEVHILFIFFVVVHMSF